MGQLTTACTLALLLLATAAFGQTTKQAKMEQLSFMVGEWIGTTTSYENGAVTRQGAAYEKVSYDLDRHLLVIELNTPFLQLHTLIYYDDEDETFYYQPFSKNGTNRYPAKLNDGQLTVWASETRRYVFGSTANGGFQEYGEQLINGQWVKYFEDTFQNTQ